MSQSHHHGSTTFTIAFMLRLSFAIGTEPGKWFRRFRETTAHGGLEVFDHDDALVPLKQGDVDLALARLPHDAELTSAVVDDSFHVVRLYSEQRGIAVPKESVYAEVGEALEPADVEDEYLNYRLDSSGIVDVAEVRAGLQVVAANVGVVIAPRPLLKMLSKKFVVPLGFVDPELPLTDIALVWPKAGDDEAIQDFVGIAKGRTARSSRQEKPKRSAREKALAKQARKQAETTTKRRDRDHSKRGAQSLPKSKKRSDRRKRGRK